MALPGRWGGGTAGRRAAGGGRCGAVVGAGAPASPVRRGVWLAPALARLAGAVAVCGRACVGACRRGRRRGSVFRAWRRCCARRCNGATRHGATRLELRGLRGLVWRACPRGWRGRRRRSVFREWRRCCAWRCNGATRVELRGGAGARVASLPRVALPGRRDARALGVARAAGARVASLPRVALQVGRALRAAGVALRLRGVMAACVAGLQRVALQRRHPVVPSRGFGAAAAVVRRRRPPRRGGWPRGPAGPGAPRARAAPRGGACGRWRG